jgi:hypothetical protein
VKKDDGGGKSPRRSADRGLASKQMAGKKMEKFRITMLFVCNVDGSECMLPMYIGKARKPQCFKKQSPAE